MSLIPAWMVMRVVEWAEHDAPLETCGIFTGRNKAESVQKLTNVAASPEHNFRMHPKQLVNVSNELERRGHRIVGTFHSHPHSDPLPSMKDYKGLRAIHADFHLIVAPLTSRDWRADLFDSELNRVGVRMFDAPDGIGFDSMSRGPGE